MNCWITVAYLCDTIVLVTIHISGHVDATVLLPLLSFTDGAGGGRWRRCNTLVMMGRAHSFPRAAEFRAEPQNLPLVAEFQHYCGIREMTGD